MAIMPGAKWRPISRNYTRRTTTKNCVITHTTASATAKSMYSWFQNPNAQASSHFHVDFDGVIEQYIDSKYMSWANSAANPRSITIETQGGGSEAWTAAQIRSIVKIIVWARSVHKGIPLRQMASSNAAQKGIGWHRLGINGNFPKTGILRGRQQRGGGQVWSSAFGKVCPGNKRIQQMPSVIKAAGGAKITTSQNKKSNVQSINRVMQTNRNNVIVRSQRTSKKNEIGKMHKKGYRVHTVLKQGSWAKIKWKGSTAWVAWAHLSEDTSAWPHVAVKVTPKHTTESHNAWVRMLAGIPNQNFNSNNLTLNIQRWLQWNGYYSGYNLDGKFQTQTVKALQRFLKAKGFYKGVVDGDRGSMTVQAEINYINSQRKYYK